MTAVSAALAYRTLSPMRTLTGSTGTALQNQNPSECHDGTLCFVTEQRSLYRLAKYSMEAVSDPSIIATIYGPSAPGRWIQLTGDRALAPLSALFFVDSNFIGVSTGSIAAPFRTVQEGIDALPSTGGTLIIVPGDYPDAWVVPENLAVVLLAEAGSQGAVGGGVTLGAGTVSDGGGVRLQELAMDADITLLGSSVVFAFDVAFHGHSILQSGAGSSQVRIAGSGIEDGEAGPITCSRVTAEQTTLGGQIHISGVISRILNCIVQSDITFTGAPGVLITDLFTMNSARGNNAIIGNASSIIVVDAPTTAATVAVPEFAAAGTASTAMAIPDAREGDTFAITNVSPLPTNVLLGQPTCTANGVVNVVFAAVAPSVAGSVDVRVTRLNGGFGGA